ncbi:MAG: hypothetical protein Q8898_08270 [Bacillota bacterium]|nr:hypothetical protein [Bacillota bacterium]
MGQVTVWQMTPEELEAYKAKHPIKPTKKPKGTGFVNVYAPEYRWPGSRKAKAARE